MKILVYTIILFSVCSCSTDKENKKNIIGNWYRLDEWINTETQDTIGRVNNSPRPPIYLPFGVEFKENDSIEYFNGIWEKFDNKLKYLGNNRYFRMSKDSLFIFNTNDILYEKYKVSFKSDTLFLKYNNDTVTLIKFQTNIRNAYRIDSIIISNENGWGKRIEYKVTSNGILSYRNYSYEEETENGKLEVWKITQEEFKKIELKYNLANFVEIKDYSGCCDGDSYTVHLYYEGKNYKRIYDYMNTSPMKLIWANRYLINMIESKKQKN